MHERMSSRRAFIRSLVAAVVAAPIVCKLVPDSRFVSIGGSVSKGFLENDGCSTMDYSGEWKWNNYSYPRIRFPHGFIVLKSKCSPIKG